MSEIPILPTNFERTRGNLTRLPIINMFAEISPADERIILQSRPGADSALLVGSVNAPVRFVYSEPGVFGADVFSVVGNSLYRGTTLIGPIDGNGPVSIDSYSDTLFLAAGASLWRYNGTTLAAVAVPDNLPVSKVFVGFGRAFAIIANSDRFYWTDVLDTVINPLSFATAENSPDIIRDAILLGDSLILFGESTTEYWMLSSDPALPFEPLVGRVYPKGVKNLGAVTQLQATFAAVTNTSQVIIGGPDNIVSSSELETEIERAASTLLWTFYLDQLEFLCVTVDAVSWIYNPRVKGLWTKFETYGETSWEPRYYTNGFFGSSVTNRLLTWSSAYLDVDRPVLERRFRVYNENTKPSLVIHNLILRTEVGTTSYLEGTYADPTVELRTSKDGGNTWSSWRGTSLGRQGDYAALARWFGLGVFSYPGLLFEFRVTDPVSFNALVVYINEPYGGL